MQILEAPPEYASSIAAPRDSGSASLLERRLFTVREFEKLYRKGLLGPDERVELIEGELIRMSPIGTPHYWITLRIHERFNALLADSGCAVGSRGPVNLGTRSQPEPDVVILRATIRDEELRLPKAADVLLVIEVSDTTLRNDLGPKARLYAKHRIPEYWVFDVEGARVVVHRDPTPAGYRTRLEARPPEVLAPLAFPHAGVDLAEVFRGVAKG